MYCFACLSKDRLQNYVIQNEPLTDIFQKTHLNLCYICFKLAKNAETFIKNVQLVDELIKTTLLDNTISIDIKPIITLTSITKCHYTDSVIYNDDFIIQNNDIINQDYVTIKQNNDSIINNIDSCIKYNDIDEKETEIKEEMKVEVNLFDEVIEAEFIDECPPDDYEDNEDGNDLVTNKQTENDSFIQKQNKNTERKLPSRARHKKVKRKKHSSSNSSKKVVQSQNKVELLYLTEDDCMEERLRILNSQKFKDSIYKCFDCLKGYKSKLAYEQHMTLHDKSQGNHICDICKQRYKTKLRLYEHLKYHRIRYKCTVCDLMRSCRVGVLEHYVKVHSDLPVQNCPYCNKSFKGIQSLKKHVKYSHQDYVICHHCNKKYSGKQALKMHIINMHPSQIAELPLPIRHFCPECGKGFKAPSYLKKHLLKHTDQKNYYCVECDKRFKTEASLKHHFRTVLSHNSCAELPFQCGNCDKGFARRRDVERHMNSVHLNNKPYQCDQCDKAYVSKWSLTEHIKFRHDGQKRPLNYPCTVCDKIFDRNQILKAHMRTHTGERPYKCDKCSASFAQSSVLATHVRCIHLKLTRDGRPKVPR